MATHRDRAGGKSAPDNARPGHEYTRDTPILMPVTIAVMEMSTSAIDTRIPAGHEPVFFPGGNVTPVSSIIPLGGGSAYDHRVPVYINYTSERPAGIWLRVSVTGTNAIWRGGWESNTYSDSVFVEIADGTKGWIEGKGSSSPRKVSIIRPGPVVRWCAECQGPGAKTAGSVRERKRGGFPAFSTIQKFCSGENIQKL